jgi:hypothetical protein
VDLSKQLTEMHFRFLPGSMRVPFAILATVLGIAAEVDA